MQSRIMPFGSLLVCSSSASFAGCRFCVYRLMCVIPDVYPRPNKKVLEWSSEHCTVTRRRIFMPKDDPKTPSKSLSQDPLVERLISDPANPEPTVHLSGWLGKATQEGMWRLYLTPQLDEYVQFSESDVVHTQPLTPDQSPLGGSVVWLKAGTPLEHTHVAKTKMQADFLSGAVTSGYMAGAVPSFATSRQAK